jgi:putative sterol carrier protein
MFEDVLRRFLANCEKDHRLQDFARKHLTVIQYTITGANLDFYMIFRGGLVTAAIGTAPAPADLIIKSDEDTFDGGMTGRIDGSAALASGKLSIKGNIMKGMAAQKILKDVVQLYKQARQGVTAPQASHPAPS